MARPHARRSPCQNCFSIGGNEPAEAALTKGSGTSTATPALVFTPTVISNPDNKLFKQFMKAYLEAQTPAQIAEEMDAKPCEQLLKTRLLDLYYGDLHLECYRFC